MARSEDVFPSFSKMLREAIGPEIDPEACDFLSMCAEDIVFEFPYAPESAVSRLEGKAALAAYLPKAADLVDIETMEISATYRDQDSETFIIEFNAIGISRVNDTPYHQNYISVIRLRDGLITQYKDYWNPLVVMQMASSGADLQSILKGASPDAR